MKLTKQDAKAHQHAVELLKKGRLSEDERWFVLEHWQAGGQHVNTLEAAYFTPVGLARDFSIEVGDGSLIDLCAGIGTLAFCATRNWGPPRRIVCVDVNPHYVEVGRKILPDATWLCADVFKLPVLGRFRWAIANPPFGSTGRNGARAPHYQGSRFEYHVIDIASTLADDGVFIIPQGSAPFRYSGRQQFEALRLEDAPHYAEFQEATGIVLENNCGLDTSVHRLEWHDVSPQVEIVIADFAEARKRREKHTTADLFS